MTFLKKNACLRRLWAEAGPAAAPSTDDARTETMFSGLGLVPATADTAHGYREAGPSRDTQLTRLSHTTR